VGSGFGFILPEKMVLLSNKCWIDRNYDRCLLSQLGYLPVNFAMDFAIRGTAEAHLMPKCFSKDFSYVIPAEMSLKIWMLIAGPFMAVNISEVNNPMS
jgi:hypothetical protein